MAIKTFFVGVKGVIVKDDKVLLLKTKHNDENFWQTPGGRIDDNETINEALFRELSEEIPNIKNPKILEVIDVSRIQEDIKGDVSLVLIFHKVTAEFDGEPQISDEHTEIRWFPIEEAIEHVRPSYKQALRNIR